MRTPLIAGNWKMHKTPSEAVRLAKQVKVLLGDCTDRDVVVCPPFPALIPVGEALRGTRIALGAQDLHWEDEGAYTGEVSASMLTDAGCSYVVVGHSERRSLFGETDADARRKVAAALRHGLIPILCVGETLAAREANETNRTVSGQLEAALAELELADPARLVIAYEPVWAIGTGRNASGAQAQEVAALIRGLLARRFGPEAAQAVRILYGGSVKPANIAEFMGQPDIDGALVGGASLEAAAFAEIAKG
ncbi:MAG TPA: triose-phosphate isomerase [Limnochordia bacterium]